MLECPNCKSDMNEIKKNNVDIDICSKCKGVWLDRGEIDKITSYDNKSFDEYEDRIRQMERKLNEVNRSQSNSNYQPPPSNTYNSGYGYDDHHEYRSNYGKHGKRRGGFFESLFD